MSILITGGLGYIGGRLATFLKEQTDEKIYLTTTRKEKNSSFRVVVLSCFRVSVLFGQELLDVLGRDEPAGLVQLGTEPAQHRRRVRRLALL